jgi:hypothetical protein
MVDEAPKLKVVEPPKPQGRSVFADLEGLRKAQKITVKRKGILTSVTVDKPPNECHFRCHRELMLDDTTVVRDGKERTTYWVHPDMRTHPRISKRLRAVTLVLTCTWPHSGYLIWPVPKLGTREFRVWTAARAAYESALERWTQMVWSEEDSNYTALLAKLQILLDRAHASPGQIDAARGENTRKAVVAYREMQGLPGGEKIDEQLWRTLTTNDQQPALVTYTITDKDTEGPFIEKVPTDFREKASLARLSYTSVQEALAEKFHMSEKLLRQLNPKATFESAGTEFVVPNVQREELPRKIARVEVSASEQRVRAYDKEHNVVAVYPATVGSSDRRKGSSKSLQ